MRHCRHPYRGMWAAIATMHGKDRAIAPALCRWFDLAISTAPGVDTDSLGTFTGEVARQGTMIEAARAKALLAIERTGAPLGIGSEGSFGPHPHLPFLAFGHEMIVLREAQSGDEVVVNRRTVTNFASQIATAHDDLTPFLEMIGFPAHAVIVRGEEGSETALVKKGISDKAALMIAVREMARRMSNGRVIIETDMRAHMNPTRMKSIERVAKRLAVRLARLCARCGAPGFGVTGVERGLRCGACRTPTDLVQAEIHSCRACGHSVRRFVRPASLYADPRWCPSCNP